MYINDNFSIYHTNIETVVGRKSSLEAIVDSLNVDIVTVNESNLKKDDKLRLEGYT